MIDKNRFYVPVTAVCLLLIVGCTTRNQTEASGDHVTPDGDVRDARGAPVEDATYAFLMEVDRESLNNAFAAVDQLNFTRKMRTEQFDSEDNLLGFDEQVTRHEGPPSNRRYVHVERESWGSFDFGYLRRFVSRAADPDDPTDLARYVLPEEPAYLSARNREAYSYRSLSDTLISDVTARVIEVRARPSDGDGQNIRRARHFVDRVDNRLIAIYIERIDEAMWYSEASRLYVHVRRAPDGAWVPHNTRFETKIALPFRPTQRFRTESSYYAYAERTGR